MSTRKTAGPSDRPDKTEWLPVWAEDEEPDGKPPPKRAPAAAPPPRPPHEEGRWKRYLLIGTICFLVIAILATGTGYVYLRWRFSQIDKESISGLVDDGGVLNVLLVGSDSRENVEGDKSFDDKHN